MARGVSERIYKGFFKESRKESQQKGIPRELHERMPKGYLEKLLKKKLRRNDPEIIPKTNSCRFKEEITEGIPKQISERIRRRMADRKPNRFLRAISKRIPEETLKNS